MAQWRTPGEPVEIELYGKTVTIKALTRKERIALMKKTETLGEGKVEAVESIFDEFAELVLSIEGVPESDTQEWIDAQDMTLLTELVTTILGGSTLTEDESKNSESSFKSSDLTPDSSDEDTQTAEKEAVSQ